MSLEITILKEYTWFPDSPEAGDPGCFCSRCNEPIDEDQDPVRMWQTYTPDMGDKAEFREYRFCENCWPHIYELK